MLRVWSVKDVGCSRFRVLRVWGAEGFVRGLGLGSRI